MPHVWQLVIFDFSLWRPELVLLYIDMKPVLQQARPNKKLLDCFPFVYMYYILYVHIMKSSGNFRKDFSVHLLQHEYKETSRALKMFFIETCTILRCTNKGFLTCSDIFNVFHCTNISNVFYWSMYSKFIRLHTSIISFLFKCRKLPICDLLKLVEMKMFRLRELKC